MADIIATREDCNGIKSGSFSSNLKRCVTRAEVESVGLAVSGWTGTSNQLVPYKYIYYPISYELTITPSSIWNGEVGDSRQYEATLYTYRGTTQIASETVTTKVTWSANNNRVSINSEGYATINSSGLTTITATYSSYGLSESVSVSAINKVRQYLTVSPSSTSVYIGNTNNTVTFSATLETVTNEVPSYNHNPSVTWSTSNNKANINSYGTATGITSGTTIITATLKSDPSVYNTATLTIIETSYKLSVIPISWDGIYDGTQKFSATGYIYENGRIVSTDSDPSVSWSSTNTSIVTIDSSGNAKAVGSGDATIKCSWNGIVENIPINISDKTTYSLSIDQSPSYIYVKDEYDLSATLTTVTNGVPSYNDDPSVTWSSTDPNIARVGNTNGTITGATSGATTIYARWNSNSNIYDWVTISVRNKKTYGISIVPSSWTGNVGDTYELDAYLITYVNGDYSSSASTSFVTWSTNNSSVATVSSNGKVTIVGDGTATITATSTLYSNASGTTLITGQNVVTRTLTLEPLSTTCYVGDKPSLTAYLITTTNGEDSDPVPQSATNINWSSSDPNVATVINGKLTTKNSGTTTITGKSKTYTSLSATASVTVRDKVSYYYSVVPSSWNAEVEDTTTFMAYLVTVTNGVESVATSPSSVAWLRDNADVVTIDPNSGYATAVGSGGATITASKGGVTGTATVTVTEPAVPDPVIEYKMTLNNSSWNGDIGDTTSFKATIYKWVDNVRVDSSMTVVTSNASWSSSNSSVVEIYSDGSAEMVGSGKATITCTYSGTLINGDKVSGVNASCSVHVYSYTYTVKGISPTSWTAIPGDTQAFSLSVQKMRDDGIVTIVTNPSGTSWASTNTIYVRMSGNVATAVFPGTAQVRGTFNGTTKTANVTVNDIVEKEIRYVTISFSAVYQSGLYIYTDWTSNYTLPCKVDVQLTVNGKVIDATLSSGSSSGKINLGYYSSNTGAVGIHPAERITSPNGSYETDVYIYDFNS